MAVETTEGGKSVSAALGRIPSGLYVLTARHGLRETAMLASWVQQCSFDPPQVSVAVRKGRYVLEWLSDGAPFALNVLAEGQKPLLRHFAAGFDPDEAAFEGVSATKVGDGAALLPDALAYLDCRVASRHDGGDHVLIVGRVVGGAVQHEGMPATHVRKSGMNY